MGLVLGGLGLCLGLGHWLGLVGGVMLVLASLIIYETD